MERVLPCFGLKRAILSLIYRNIYSSLRVMRIQKLIKVLSHTTPLPQLLIVIAHSHSFWDPPYRNSYNSSLIVAHSHSFWDPPYGNSYNSSLIVAHSHGFYRGSFLIVAHSPFSQLSFLIVVPALSYDSSLIVLSHSFWYPPSLIVAHSHSFVCLQDVFAFIVFFEYT